MFKRQKIVKSVSGYAAPGTTTYIMGASGAGKTSLLNILADRVSLRNNATLSGNILFNDEMPCDGDACARYAAYVQQDDILFSYFTVQEALTRLTAIMVGAGLPTHAGNPLAEQRQAALKLLRELGYGNVVAEIERS